MSNKNYIYSAITMRADNGKLFAEAIRIPANRNLASIIRDLHSIEIMTIMPTRAQAIETAHAWEDSYINNGTAYFDRNYVTNCFDL